MTLLSCFRYRENPHFSQSLTYFSVQVALYIDIIIPKTWDLGL